MLLHTLYEPPQTLFLQCKDVSFFFFNSWYDTKNPWNGKTKTTYSQFHFFVKMFPLRLSYAEDMNMCFPTRNPCLGHIPFCSDHTCHLYPAWPVSKPLHCPTIHLQPLKRSSLGQKPKEGSAAALGFLHAHCAPINKTEQTFTSEEISTGHELPKIKTFPSWCRPQSTDFDLSSTHSDGCHRLSD